MIVQTVVPAVLVTFIWPHIEAYISDVVDVSSGELSMDGVKNNMLKGGCTTVLIVDDDSIIGVCTLEEHIFDSGLKALYIPIIGGERIDEWGVSFFESCIDVGKNLGCTELRGLAARTGWMRKLKKYNYDMKPCYEVLKYELN